MSSPAKVTPYDPAAGPGDIITPPCDIDGAPRRFEIGLVLAGAVSAGAYTGGVLDFLFEALDDFTAARAASQAPDHPLHDVVIKVISGASAGGMTAAMVAAAACWTFPHIRNDEDAVQVGDNNPFYAAWVKQIDMRLLLGDRDLGGKAPLRSLLDCTVLDDILAATLSYPAYANPAPKRIDRPWLDDGLKLCMSVTNLRGISYQFGFSGSPGSVYAMTRHNDAMRFRLKLRAATPARPDEFDLPPIANLADAGWAALGQTALATGSFPLALRARTVRPKPGFYNGTWFVDDASANRMPNGRFTVDAGLLHLSPAFPANAAYSYASADGGIIDNEPLEMARVELAGIMGSNPRNAEKACRAVILVDPFPDPPLDGTLTDADQASIFDVAAGLIAAMKNQGRFHPDDIRLALDPDTYSRFMISPSGPDDKTGGAALASGALGGFSGFLDESYRHHDFMLGRLNCRNFLIKYFRIPVDVGGTRSWLFDQEPPTMDGDTADGRAIIPLSAAITGQTAQQPAWPLQSFDPATLRGAISRRIDAVGAKVIAATPSKPMKLLFQAIWGAGVTGGIIRRQVTGLVVGALTRALVAHGLIPATSNQED